MKNTISVTHSPMRVDRRAHCRYVLDDRLMVSTDIQHSADILAGRDVVRVGRFHQRDSRALDPDCRVVGTGQLNQRNLGMEPSD